MTRRRTTAYIALGSNLGDRRAHIRRAFTGLAALPETRLVRRSRLLKSLPAGGPPGQRDYLNAAARIETSLSPMALLVELKRIEALHGRRPAARRWSARTLDLDIISYGNLRLKTPLLTLPHPLARSRSFVRIPIAELGPTRPAQNAKISRCRRAK